MLQFRFQGFALDQHGIARFERDDRLGNAFGTTEKKSRPLMCASLPSKRAMVLLVARSSLAEREARAAIGFAGARQAHLTGLVTRVASSKASMLSMTLPAALPIIQ
jgi:hypothetical protein